MDATRQEKRSYVCGQCHVEYFCGKGTTIFFPWGEGLKVEEMERLYDGMQVKGQRFKDWTHAETGMEVLKAQHPEFEMWSQGIHARSGVACADCHMSYRRDGAQKISEHWVRSPLLSANRSCATCHPYSDEELKSRVEAIQDRHFALMTRAGQAAVAMIDAIVAVRKPYDERNRSAAAAKAKETLEKNADFQKLPKEEQEKKLAAETKANLLVAWRGVVEKDACPQGAGRAAARRAVAPRLRGRRELHGLPRPAGDGPHPGRSRSTCRARRRSRRAKSCTARSP